MGLFKKVSKAVSKAAEGVGKTAKHEVKRATKIGFLDPLGLTQGKEKRQQRLRKGLRIGAGMAGGAMKGGIYGAIAGGAVAGYGASKKGQGNVAFTLGRGIKDFGSGYLAGMGTNAIASKMAGAAPALGSKLSMYPSGGALNASLASSAPAATSTAASTAGSSWGSTLAGQTAKDVAKQAVLNQVTQPQVQPMPQEPMYDPMAARQSSDANIQSMLAAYNKRKERYFYQ